MTRSRRSGRAFNLTRDWSVLTRFAAALLLALAFLSGSHELAGAQDEPLDVDTVLEEVATKRGEVEAQLNEGRLNAAQIEELRATLESRRKILIAAAKAAEAVLAPLNAEIAVLGPAPEDGTAEPDAIAAKRAELQAQIAPVDARLRNIQVAQARIEGLADRLLEFRRIRFTRVMLERQPTPVSPGMFQSAWESLKLRSAAIPREVEARLHHEGSEGLADRLALPLFMALAAFALAIWLRRSLISWIRGRVDSEVSHLRRARLTAAITLVRLILPSIGVAMVAVGLSQSGLLGPNGTILLENSIIAAAFLIVAYALGGAFFAPRSSGLRISRLSDRRAAVAYTWFLLLTVVLALDQILVNAGREMRLTLEALSVLNMVFLIVGGIALWRLVHAIGIGRTLKETEADGEAQDHGGRWLRGTVARVALTFVAIVAPLLSLAGYFAASRFLFYPSVYTFALIGAAVVIHMWVVTISKSEPTAKAEEEEDGEAGEDATLSAVPVIAGLVLTILVLPLLAIIWGARATDLSSAWSLVVEGFHVGDITIAPMDFFVFGFVFAIGFFITRTIQGVMRRSVMPVLRIDVGAKAALLAGIGYIGFTVAALIAISTTGLDLSNLAIVAGALSVGIGFGLQNVVNNFVSGIILLIERPIKVGDWIEINGSQGMVRRINVRSTQIQKFDRSTMFVPNADLISGTVTNRYFGHGEGQLILPVGVAYGSDARKVEKILLEAAAAHPMVLRHPAPFVVFKDFGASSLDFELRGVMADVNMILTLPSELRYTIYRRFNEQGIEIPFAQRDITIRNIAELRDAGGLNG